MSTKAPDTDRAAGLSLELSSVKDAGQRLRLLADRFSGRIMASSSFGAQAAVMLHLLKEHAPEIPIVFIDTGYLFKETYQFAEQLIKTWDLNI
ncbi:MAG: phosphoadenosine phosphosulfate reductase family protein, partial [Verrucomicrobiota bacterium]